MPHDPGSVRLCVGGSRQREGRDAAEAMARRAFRVEDRSDVAVIGGSGGRRCLRRLRPGARNQRDHGYDDDGREENCLAHESTVRAKPYARIVPEARQKRLPARWVLAVIGVAILAVAVDIGAFVFARGGSTAGIHPASADSVAVIDPASADGSSRGSRSGHQPTMIRRRLRRCLGAEQGRRDGDAHRRSVAQDRRHGRGRRHRERPDGRRRRASGSRGTRAPPGAARSRPPRSSASIPRAGPIDRSFLTNTGASVVAAGGGALWSTGYLGGRIRGAARSDARSRGDEQGRHRHLRRPRRCGRQAVYYVGSGATGSRASRRRTGRTHATR